MPDFGERKYNYEKVFSSSGHKNNDATPGGARPQWGMSPIEIPVAIAPGTFRLGVWLYPDSGNISVKLERMTLLEDTQPEPQSTKSEDDNDGGFGI